MKDFPMFMKNELNHIPNNQQNTKDIDGYWFEGKDGSQVAYWTYYADSVSAEHVHDYDEYTICVCGEYLITINGKKLFFIQETNIIFPRELFMAEVQNRVQGQYMLLAEKEL